MPSLAERVARRFQVATTHRLDLQWVEKLRKDFLTLLKNLPLVKDYATAFRLYEAVNAFRARFNEIVIIGFMNKGQEQLSSFEYDKTDADWKRLRTIAGEFEMNLRLPFRPADQYNPPERQFREFEKDFPAWKTRVQRKGAAFWKEMKQTIEAHETQGRAIDVVTPTVENATVEGFKLRMIGFVETDPNHAERLHALSEGLRLYRKRASSVAPILLKKQLPIECMFATTLDQGGEYHPDHITFYLSSIGAKGPSWVAHAIAHEMGHCLWRTYLSSDAQSFWTQTIKGDYGDLDIKELLEKWPRPDVWAFDFPRYLGESDPILALQVQAVGTDDLQSKDQFQALYDSGTRTLRVPKTPITGYANKNPEEAFCETMGLLIAHGQRAVHERVRWWLDTALPGAVRTAATRRPAG